jgi:DNA-binding MarR family transcriptional regulator
MCDADSAQPRGEEPLAELEAQAWGVLTRAHAALVRGLDADLRTAHGLALGDFAILTLLNRESCRPLRMAALADSALLSPSGLSRAIERLESRRLVRRDRCPDDGRGTLAQLTESGAALLETAGSTHAGAIRKRFLQRLTLEQLETLTETLLSVLTDDSDGCCPAASPVDVVVGEDTTKGNSTSNHDGSRDRSRHVKSPRRSH